MAITSVLLILALVTCIDALVARSLRTASSSHRIHQLECQNMIMSTYSPGVSMSQTIRPLVVCGPSGVGKGTLLTRFLVENKNTLSGTLHPEFRFSVSHTTRQPRPDEVNGVHYHFVTRDFFWEKINKGDFFVEHAEVHGNMYGTSFQSLWDVEQQNQNTIEKGGLIRSQQCVLDIDVEGVKNIKEFQRRQKTMSMEQSPHNCALPILPQLQASFIFIAPPSLAVLHQRLMGRGTETPETLERRFQNARAELEYGLEPSNFDAVVVNDDLERAFHEFTRIVRNMYEKQ